MNDVEKQLDQIAYRTIHPYAWIGLIGLFIAIAGLLSWSIWGTLSIYIEGKGVVMNQSGLFSIQTPAAGIVKTLFVKAGDEIDQGSLIAEIYDAQKHQALNATKLQVEALTKEVDRLTRQIEVETEASRRALNIELDSIEYTIKILRQQLSFLEKEYDKKMKLYDEELVVIGVVQDAKRQVHDVEVGIAEKEKEASEVQAKLAQSYRTEELKSKKLELMKAQQEVLVLQTALELNKIYSPHKGKVLEILVNQGERVKEEQSLIYAEFWSPEEKLVFYAYFPSEYGKYIHVGSRMEVFLSTVNPKEFGALLSRVESISEYPISEQAIISQIHNANLARFLTNQEPVTQVIAAPIKDLRDPSGYAWTSHQGPPITLSSGTVGRVEVDIETIHPIYYLFPNKEFKKSSIKNPL
jgi:HlyD family secretion protein